MGHNPIQSNHFCEKEIVSTSNIAFTKNDGIFEMLKWENDAKIGNDADLIYKQGGTMAYIKKKSERKFKITVCNGYKVNGQKRMKAQTITVPSSVPKRGIQQYVMAEAERIEKKFKYGVEESDQRVVNTGWRETGYLILKVDSLPVGKKSVFTIEEIHLARTAVNQLRNKKIQQGQYTDATDDMLLKLF